MILLINALRRGSAVGRSCRLEPNDRFQGRDLALQATFGWTPSGLCSDSHGHEAASMLGTPYFLASQSRFRPVEERDLLRLG